MIILWFPTSFGLKAFSENLTAAQNSNLEFTLITFVKNFVKLMGHMDLARMQTSFDDFFRWIFLVIKFPDFLQFLKFIAYTRRFSIYVHVKDMFTKYFFVLLIGDIT